MLLAGRLSQPIVTRLAEATGFRRNACRGSRRMVVPIKSI